MAPQIWTRIIIASLIFLGNGVAACESVQRSNIEAITANSTNLIAYSDVIDGPDTLWLPLFSAYNFKQNRPAGKYLRLASFVELSTSSSKYQLYIGRAPPALS